MAGLGYVLGGFLEGAGKGLAMQGQERAAQAAADLESRRRIALENLRAENNSANSRLQADLNDRNDARATARKTDATIVTDSARTENDIRLEGVRSSNQAANQQALARLQSSLNLTEYEKKAALDLKSELDKEGRTAARFEVTADGRMVAYSGTGQVLRASPPGTFTPPGSKDGGSIIEQARAAQSTPAPAPSPAPTKPAPAQTPKGAGAAQTYTLADAQATARKHGVSVEEVHKRMRAAGWKLSTE
jgi:hypothetical protein